MVPGYGDFADLFLGYYVFQNWCNISLDNTWGFFSGSTYAYDIGCGGNGSQAGAFALSSLDFPVVGIASTIDNDLLHMFHLTYNFGVDEDRQDKGPDSQNQYVIRFTLHKSTHFRLRLRLLP